MPHLFLLGTRHSLQCGIDSESESGVASFTAELIRLIDNRKIMRIAEEMGDDGLKEHKVKTTVAQRVANSREIDHHFVDIGYAERKALGMGNPFETLTQLYPESLTDRGQNLCKLLTVFDNELRERVWINRLLSLKTGPTLFICGAEHVTPIARIWQLLGLKVEIEHYDYGSKP